jgi:hypothetical protein
VGAREALSLAWAVVAAGPTCIRLAGNPGDGRSLSDCNEKEMTRMGDRMSLKIIRLFTERGFAYRSSAVGGRTALFVEAFFSVPLAEYRRLHRILSRYP